MSNKVNMSVSLYGIYSQQFAGTLKFNEKGGGSLDTLYVQCVEDWKRIMGTYFFKCKGVENVGRFWTWAIFIFDLESWRSVQDTIMKILNLAQKMEMEVLVLLRR
jgi:hypothetical protein